MTSSTSLLDANAHAATPSSCHTVGMHIVYLRDSADLYATQGLCHATPASAGLDLRAAWEPRLGDSIHIPAGARYAVPTGIAMEIMQAGIAGFVYSRSGLGAKHGLTVAQGVGVIDADYRGEIVVWLLNTSQQEHTVQRGDRIAQLVLQPVFHAQVQAVHALGETSRGSGGFGHTGAR